MTDLTEPHLRLVRRKVVEEDWVSNMNDTKWNELFREIQEDWLPWCYRQKSILETDFGVPAFPPRGWQTDWWFGFLNIEIEIMDIHPFVYRSTGERDNQTSDLKSMLGRIGVPYESSDEFIRIRAYTASNRNQRSEQ